MKYTYYILLLLSFVFFSCGKGVSFKLDTIDDIEIYLSQNYIYSSENGHTAYWGGPWLFFDDEPYIRVVSDERIKYQKMERGRIILLGKNVQSYEDESIDIRTKKFFAPYGYSTICFKNTGKTITSDEIIYKLKKSMMQCTNLGCLERYIDDESFLEQFQEISVDINSRLATSRSIGDGPLYTYQSDNRYIDNKISSFFRHTKYLNFTEAEIQSLCNNLHTTREEAEKEQARYEEYVRETVNKARDAYIKNNPNDHRYGRLY